MPPPYLTALTYISPNRVIVLHLVVASQLRTLITEGQGYSDLASRGQQLLDSS